MTNHGDTEDQRSERDAEPVLVICLHRPEFFQRCVKMILDISQLQNHVSGGKSEFVRDKAIAPHRARRFSTERSHRAGMSGAIQ